VRRELKTGDDVAVIVQASRLETWKGHRAHLEGLGLLRDRRDWVCWMVGGPQRPHEHAYFEELKSLATRLGIADRVRFVGHRTDVRRLLEGADIACQPNTGPEPFGMALVEALFARLPIVTTALGGGREVADTTCAVVVPAGDPAALAAALAGLLDDAPLRAKLSAGAPVRARMLCDAAGQVRALAHALRSLVDVREHPSG
jgi:glycosyltransferase involved in cell wall biosynthesis